MWPDPENARQYGQARDELTAMYERLVGRGNPAPVDADPAVSMLPPVEPVEPAGPVAQLSPPVDDHDDLDPVDPGWFLSFDEVDSRAIRSLGAPE